MADENEVPEGALSNKEIIGRLFPFLRKDVIERKHRLVAEVNDFGLFLLAILIGLVGNTFVEEMFRLGDIPVTSPVWGLHAATFAVSVVCILGSMVWIYLILRNKQKQISDIDHFLNWGLRAYASEKGKESTSRSN